MLSVCPARPPLGLSSRIIWVFKILSSHRFVGYCNVIIVQYQDVNFKGIDMNVGAVLIHGKPVKQWPRSCAGHGRRDNLTTMAEECVCSCTEVN